MDLHYTRPYEDYREKVRAFLSESWPPSGDDSKLGPTQQAVSFRKRAIERGFLARSVPRKYGGSEQPLDPLRGAVIHEEFARVSAPRNVGPPTAQLIPTLLSHGTEEQKLAFLPKTLTGQMVWCQGYSEPGAGSDLASVQTRAELVDDHWIINGQKIWTSGAQTAEMIYMLLRTEAADAGKHGGLSYLLVDMNCPGIDVRPLRGIDGSTHFNEVFFDDVRVPADRIVGKRGQGWIVSRSTLQAERDLVGLATSTLELWEELLQIARSTVRSGGVAIKDATIRQRLVELEGYVASHEYSSYRQLTCNARGENPGLIGTMNKLVSTEIGSRMARLAVEIESERSLAAPRGQRGSTSPDGKRGAVAAFYGALGLRSAGGATNIQRNIVGERGLGLPRDSAVLKKAGKT